MSIKIRDWKTLKGFMVVPFHSKLIGMAEWVTVRYSNVVFTSAYRRGDTGVHGTIPCRGLDIRSWIYEDPQSIVDDINAHWRYDPLKRPEMMCAILHNVGQGEHIHLQVHDNTQYLREDNVKPNTL